MRKIIAIGECVLDVVLRGQVPVKAMVGGRIANAAASLGAMGLPVYMTSECCTDKVGDQVVGFLKAHNVDTTCIDRFTDGSTSLSVIYEDGDGNATQVNYGRYPKDRFDVVWPRIDPDDIILFGSLYAIDSPQRERLFELVQYAAERKAVIVYLPGFQHGISFRLTRVMTALLENLEISDIVIAHDRDIADIFPGETAEQAYKTHIEYYCPLYMHIHSDLSLTVFSHHGARRYAAQAAGSANLLGWQAGFTAGVIYALQLQGIGFRQAGDLDPDQLNAIVTKAIEMANLCAASSDNCLGHNVAGTLRQQLLDAQAARNQEE